MSSHFSANQYEGAFDSKALGNWEEPQTYKSRPFTLKGHTQIIGDNRGHLKDCVPRSANNPWGNFIGTWEMPEKIAGKRACVPTGRTSNAQQKLSEESRAAQGVLSGTAKNQQRKARMTACAPEPAPAAPAVLVAPPAAPAAPVEVMCDVIAAGRSPTPPARSPLPPNPAQIDADHPPLFRSADL